MKNAPRVEQIAARHASFACAVFAQPQRPAQAESDWISCATGPVTSAWVFNRWLDLDLEALLGRRVEIGHRARPYGLSCAIRFHNARPL